MLITYCQPSKCEYNLPKSVGNEPHVVHAIIYKPPNTVARSRQSNQFSNCWICQSCFLKRSFAFRAAAMKTDFWNMRHQMARGATRCFVAVEWCYKRVSISLLLEFHLKANESTTGCDLPYITYRPNGCRRATDLLTSSPERESRTTVTPFGCSLKYIKHIYFLTEESVVDTSIA